MSNGDQLMEEWEEFKRFEKFQETQAMKKPPEPEPRVDPHLCYAQGSHGQTIVDFKAFSRDYKLDDGPIGTDVVDRRDNRDPEQVWNEILNERNGKGDMVIYKLDPDAPHIGQISPDEI